MSTQDKTSMAIGEEQVLAKAGAKPLRKVVRFSIMDSGELDSVQKSSSLEKSLQNSAIEVERGNKVNRIAFEEDPVKSNSYQGLWKPKEHLVPDAMIKRIMVRDSLVAAIVNARCNQISAFGRELQDRFATGFRIEPRRGVMEDASPQQKEALQKRIADASKKLSTCGESESWDADERMSLSTFLYQQARNGVGFGRFATEIIYITEADGKKKFHSFRPVDAATIFQVVPQATAADQVRKQALALLQRLKNEKLKPEKFVADEYPWMQVIANQPRQAFTAEELVVHNCYPVTDIEYGGYPVTPVDTAIDDIVTHMNIGTHNKLYFQNGRASRGMIIIKSDDVTQDIIDAIRQHFSASINSVSNSWRVPVFGIGKDDSIEWEPLEMQGGRDMEYQYLADSNARVILSAFQMSPEELPGYQHLSRGTNNQALSESSNEYKLEAARDVGIRPLLSQFQDFLNDRILPLLDDVVSKLCTLKLYGLDADTAEKESTRLQADQALHLTYDQILERVEKDAIGEEFGGEFPLNPAYQAVLDKYFSVGEIKEKFFKCKGAAKDPNLQYFRDPFWFQNVQLQQAQQQMEQQQQAQQQQAQAQQQQDQTQGAEGDGAAPEAPDPNEGEVAQGVDQLLQMLGKSEAQLPPNQRRLLAQHNVIVKTAMDAWEQESERALAEIVKTVSTHHSLKPKKKS